MHALRRRMDHKIVVGDNKLHGRIFEHMRSSRSRSARVSASKPCIHGTGGSSRAARRIGFVTGLPPGPHDRKACNEDNWLVAVKKQPRALLDEDALRQQLCFITAAVADEAAVAFFATAAGTTYVVCACGRRCWGQSKVRVVHLECGPPNCQGVARLLASNAAAFTRANMPSHPSCGICRWKFMRSTHMLSMRRDAKELSRIEDKLDRCASCLELRRVSNSAATRDVVTAPLLVPTTLAAARGKASRAATSRGGRIQYVKRVDERDGLWLCQGALIGRKLEAARAKRPEDPPWRQRCCCR